MLINIKKIICKGVLSIMFYGQSNTIQSESSEALEIIENFINNNEVIQKFIHSVFENISWEHVDKKDDYALVYVGDASKNQYSLEVSAVRDKTISVNVYIEDDNQPSKKLFTMNITDKEYPEIFTIDDNDENYTGDYNSFFIWLYNNYSNIINQNISHHYIRENFDHKITIIKNTNPVREKSYLSQKEL